jgi:type III restriction enzyme
LNITDINGKKRENIQWLQEGDTFFVKDNNDIKTKDFTVSKIDESKTNPSIIFSNGETLYKDKPYSFDGEPDMGQSVKTVQEGQTNYPVFNFVLRTVKATSLTRPTIISIFDAIDGKKKQKIMTNPEGFAAVFIETIKEQLANHVASKLEYTLSQNVPQIKVAAKQDLQGDLFTYETADIEQGQFAAEEVPSFGESLDDYFPLEKSFPQRELIDGSEHSLYTKIQKDSQVEENFINKRIKPEDGQDGKIICYFKFPANFKVYIPKILGKYYNPDWGIIRLDKDGKTKIQLVRETKGTEDTARLRFTNERRKVECAKKHFKTIGVSYRPVSDKTLDWWLEEE